MKSFVILGLVLLVGTQSAWASMTGAGTHTECPYARQKYNDTGRNDNRNLKLSTLQPQAQPLVTNQGSLGYSEHSKKSN